MSSGKTGTGSTTRTLQVCEACRIRKIRCDPDERGCQHCREIGIDCVRAPVIRFKDMSNQKSMAFSPDQTWTQPRGTLRYHDETPLLVDFYHGDDSAALKRAMPYVLSDGAPAMSEIRETASSGLASWEVNQLPDPSEAILDTSATTTTRDQGQPSPAAELGLFSNASPATNSQTNQSPWTGYSMESSELVHSSEQISQPLSAPEAFLLRNFVDNMALWADGPDPRRSFELEASRIALTDPILRHAICAFSSRHVHRHHTNRDAEALEHQDKCLQLLIPAMSEQHSTSEGVLAAVAILRQNEEMDEYDNRFHLEGITRIHNDVSAFASSGGLREATAWLCLREDIYVSLTTQTAIRTDLAPFENATWIQGESDFSWANRMVLLLAKLLSVVFLEAPNTSAFADVRDRITQWHASKPRSFEPLQYLSRNRAVGRHVPDLWMLAPPHAIGLQYYYIAQLVLAASARLLSMRPFDHIHEHRAVERQVRQHLLHVVGIAKSNPRAQNTLFTAHHCLAVWGGCLRKSGDQEACLHFLKDMELQTGWRIAKLTEQLTIQWQDDSD